MALTMVSSEPYVGLYSITSISPEYAKAPYEGYDKDLFICPICLCAIIEPIMNCSCSHIFCLDCYRQMITTEDDDKIPCPVCRCLILTYTTTGYNAFSPVLRRLLDMVIYSCPSPGCSFSGPLSKIKKHFHVCPKLEVTCPNTGCDVKGPREIMAREHNRACKNGIVLCLVCSNFVPRQRMSEHKCPVQVIRVFGRGEALLNDERRHYVQCVLLYRQACFIPAELDQRLVREVIKLRTVWGVHPIPEGTNRIQEYIEQNPNLVGPDLHEQHGVQATISMTEISSAGFTMQPRQILYVEEQQPGPSQVSVAPAFAPTTVRICVSVLYAAIINAKIFHTLEWTSAATNSNRTDKRAR